MHIKTLLVIFIVAVISAGPLLGITNFVNNNIHDHQAFANHLDTSTSQETTILHQGISASSPSAQVNPRSNEQLQQVVILPYRIDGSVYEGVLTFTATKPVEVTLSHRIPVDNATLAQIDTQKFGELHVRHLSNLTGAEGNMSAPSRIIPDYRGSSSSPYFSASIPFVASTVVLRTNGEPFIVAYEVSADIIQQPKIIRHLENATITNSTVS